MMDGEVSDFISFPFFGFNLVIKRGNFDFESHLKTLIFLDKKDMVPDFNMSHEKMFHFVSFLLFGFI